jgi:hypothetical protein
VICLSTPWIFESDQILPALEDSTGDFGGGLLGAVGSPEWDPALAMMSARGAVEPTDEIIRAMDQRLGTTAITSVVDEFGSCILKTS